MDWWLIFAVFLYLVSAILIVAEVFVPSGGLISVCSLVCLAGGLVIFFRQSNTAGWIGVVIAIVMIPTVLILAYRLFPSTGFGKSVILAPPQRRQGDAIPDSEQLQAKLGAVGTVISPLRPVGTCDFSGERLECVAESGYVDKGTKVKVIHVRGTQLTVRAIQS